MAHRAGVSVVSTCENLSYPGLKTPELADELHGLLARFAEENGARRENTLPFEYALVLYNAEDRSESTV